MADGKFLDFCSAVLQVKKVFLIRIAQQENYMLDLEHVWVLDDESRQVQVATVERHTDTQDPTEIMLRIL